MSVCFLSLSLDPSHHDRVEPLFQRPQVGHSEAALTRLVDVLGNLAPDDLGDDVAGQPVQDVQLEEFLVDVVKGGDDGVALATCRRTTSLTTTSQILTPFATLCILTGGRLVQASLTLLIFK